MYLPSVVVNACPLDFCTFLGIHNYMRVNAKLVRIHGRQYDVCLTCIGVQIVTFRSWVIGSNRISRRTSLTCQANQNKILDGLFIGGFELFEFIAENVFFFFYHKTTNQGFLLMDCCGFRFDHLEALIMPNCIKNE